MRKTHVEDIGWMAGAAGLAAIALYDAAGTVTSLPQPPERLHTLAVAVTVGAVGFCGLFRASIRPTRLAFLQGWVARGESDEAKRKEGEPSNVYQLPARAFASELAQTASDSAPSRPRHRAAERRPAPRRPRVDA